MKKILMMAALAFIGFTAKAQMVANNSGCDVEYRQFCVDPVTCAITYPNPTWRLLAPGNPPALLNTVSCSAGGVIGYEVRYASSTGCNYPSVFLYDNIAPYHPPCPPIFLGQYLGSCSCSNNPDGVDVVYNDDTLIFN